MANGDPKPNLKLRDYLINLAIKDDIRAELNGPDRAKREAAIRKHNAANQLDDADIKALLDRSFGGVRDSLRVNQQNT